MDKNFVICRHYDVIQEHFKSVTEEAQPHISWIVTLGRHQFLVELKIIRKLIIIIIIIIIIIKKMMVVKVTKGDEEDGDINDNNDEEGDDDDFYC